MRPDGDDTPVGRLLSRRDAVRLLALGGAAAAVGCNGSGNSAESERIASSVTDSAGGNVMGPVPKCVAKPELTAGPYFLDQQLNRSDIRLEPSTNVVKEGAVLQLALRVQQIANGKCTPLSGAMVDIWHCDAAGTYSGVNDNMIGFNTVGQKFLRGFQVTDKNGIARFTTIYPGWYPGRTPHIHFKVRTPASAVAANQKNSIYEFTSQLFFDDSLSDQVFASAPYSTKGVRDRRNSDDGIYREAGDTLMLDVTRGTVGYDASFELALDLSDAETGMPDGMGRESRPRGRPPGQSAGGRRPVPGDG
jgi:protocatechuate 3,4-dioxygenase beta subunit